MKNAFLTSILVTTFYHFLLVQLALAVDEYIRADFPPEFVFGTGTSAYQYEGAASEDGRTPSIWDTWTHSGHTNGANGDVTCDGYHKYKEDIRLMSDMGLEAFRFSISWSRLIPNGRGDINKLGVQYYNNFINELISHGIQPHVTLYHFDMPQALEDEYGGWLSRNIVKDFTAFADMCFKEFGDRVLHWTTINEANVCALSGYDIGDLPPGRSSSFPGGNSSTEPYIVGHNLLLAHSAAARLYKNKYKAIQKGYVGFNLNGLWVAPYTNSTEDVIAAQRAMDFLIGWLLNPLIYGDYPEIVKINSDGRAPAFTKEESQQIKGSIDFLALNHYFILYVKDNPSLLENSNRDVYGDMAVKLIFAFGDTPGQFRIMPSGLYDLLDYLKQHYGNPPVYIHENGQSMVRNGTLMDTPRIEYIHSYIGSLLDAVRSNGSNTKGYFAWSFMDCLELLDGYGSGFGFYYVDLDDSELKRYEKLSAGWYSSFLKGGITSSKSVITDLSNTNNKHLHSEPRSVRSCA